MNVTTCVVGPIEENCYIIEEEGEVLIIDPGDDAEELLEKIAGKKLKYIALTHGHWDHIGAVSTLAANTGAPVACSALDVDLVENCDNEHVKSKLDGMPKVDIELSDGDNLKLGNLVFDVIATPGHTPGSVCYYNEQDRVLFSGDTLFQGGRHGRCDFEGGSLDDMISSLKNKLNLLPDETIIYPGHEASSTMKKEREANQYLS